ncbi:MAG: TniB family NTP-binding protein [Chloroflexota bacterium]|nr:TniB family NTP-binding protein [Chloroflexota bacterium]
MPLTIPLPVPAAPLATKEGWALHVQRRPIDRPDVPAVKEWERIPEDERRRFDRMRRAYHADFGPILTPTLTGLVEDLIDRALSNMDTRSGARPGAVMDGPANLGKTTILAHFGRRYERLLRREHGDDMQQAGYSEWHPVVYHSLTPNTSFKSLCEDITFFYGAPVPRSANTDALLRTVRRCAQECATTLFLIDDIHYLDVRHRGAREVNNGLKKLANETSATFVYAGIDCQHSGLLAGGGADMDSFGQTRGRFARLNVEPFRDGDEDWLRLVKAFEEHLVLLKARDGMCVRIADYLHERTNGYVGALSNLLRLGAAKAVQNGEERITRRLLESIYIDDASETARAVMRKSRRPGSRSSLGQRPGQTR